MLPLHNGYSLCPARYLVFSYQKSPNIMKRLILLNHKNITRSSFNTYSLAYCILFFLLLTYSSALQPFMSPGLLYNFLPFLSLLRYSSPSTDLHFLQILLHILQPPFSRPSSSFNPYNFIM